MTTCNIRRLYSTVLLAVLWLPCAMAQGPLIFDNDGSELLLNTYWNGQPLTLWHLDSLTRTVAHTQVGTYAICSGSDTFYYPSRLGRRFGDDLKGRIAHGGNHALYATLHTCHRNLERIDSAGGEFVSDMLALATRHGMQAMLTLRLNDLHFTDKEIDCPVAYSDWWLSHPQYHIGDNTLGWHSAGAYDFAHRAVRRRKLAAIREQLHRYREQTDWYLIDYMRFFCYFRRGEGRSHTAEMTDMLRQVRLMADRESRRRHRQGRIRIAVRVAPSIEENLEKGIDLRQWLVEGLIDMVAVGIHTLIDPNMPIARLRTDLGASLKVPLYASNDMVTYTENEPLSEGMMRGFCSAALSQGADGIYLFNYFLNDYNRGRYHIEDGGLVCRVPHPRMLSELGSLSTLEGRNKTYWLSDGKRQYGLRPNTPLPLTIEPGSQHSVHIYVGDRMDSIRPQEAILFLRTRHKATLSVSLNGQPMEGLRPDYPQRYDKCRRLGTDEYEYAVSLPPAALRHGDNSLQIASQDSTGAFTLRRLELTLRYGDVGQYGYF